jgi:peptidoglycan/LPS O-acetylase OafA/YrhL
MTHLRALDGMRGAAVLAVIAFHYLVFGAGWTGVQMFFVLSGFLITSILVAERNSPFAFYLKRFYWRRSLRIFPLYFAFIGVMAIAATFSFGPAAAFRQQRAYLLTYTFNYACLWRECSNPWYWDHLWSLSVEEQFYLIWPALVFFLPRRVLGWVLVGIVVVIPLLRFGIDISFAGRIAGHRTGAVIYFLTVCQWNAFASGALVAYAVRLGLHHCEPVVGDAGVDVAAGNVFQSTFPGAVILFALYLGVTLAVSQLSYSAFERRFLALKNRRFVTAETTRG